MSDEYNESPATESRSGCPTNTFIPLVLLSLSLIMVCVVFIKLLDWQLTNANTQQTLLQSAIKNQEDAVTQSQKVQDGVKKLASDLVEAAQTDDTAKQIAAKYIRANGSPAPAASPSGK